MPYIPNSRGSLDKMLNEMGFSSFDELYDSAVPKNLQFQGEMDIPAPLSEMDVVKRLKELAGKNSSTEELVNFMGFGTYNHYIPAAVEAIVSRPEFYTAYTPYQSEVSQGTLQAIFEYQTMICALTGMPVANASMYDGASAAAEAANMAISITGHHTILYSDGLNPLYRDVVARYIKGIGGKMVGVPLGGRGLVDSDALESLLDDDVAAFILQNPNFLGFVEDGFPLGEIMKNHKGLFIVVAEPISLGFLTPPGEYEADIVVGEGQSLGIPLSFGGPFLGFFAARRDFIRRMPGRIIGRTTDADGNRGFVMTYQTREQHIRREKATSNICTNQQLMALTALVYLSLVGESGFKKIARLSFEKAHYLRDRLDSIDGIELLYPETPFFREFPVMVKTGQSSLAEFIEAMAYRGFLAGVDLGRFDGKWQNVLLVAATEQRTKDEIDNFADRTNELLR